MLVLLFNLQSPPYLRMASVGKIERMNNDRGYISISSCVAIQRPLRRCVLEVGRINGANSEGDNLSFAT